MLNKRSVLCIFAGLAGATVMVIEIMSVRIMAPWFGQSQPVWTNVISVVLGALAVGQWLGGRWAEGRRGGVRPAVLLMCAGLLSAALPTAIALLAGGVMPSDLELTEAYSFVTWGSLWVSLIALGLPLVALGAVTPWLVKLCDDAADAPGLATGRILGSGTIGSLIGTYGATHLLLPSMGSSMTVQCAGAAVFLGGAWMAGMEKGLGRGGLLVMVAALPLVWVTESSDWVGGKDVLESIETPYQFSYVERDDSGVLHLRINEGLGSFHSVTVPGEALTGQYFDAFLLPALTCPTEDERQRRILVLGMGGGTMGRQIHEFAPEAEVIGVELDSSIVRLGRQYLGLPEAVEVWSEMDGRTALRVGEDPYGAILVDAYAQQIYLPHHMCTVEFFEELRHRLLPGGVAALNLGGLTREDPVVEAVAGTFARVMDSVVLARVPGNRNLIALGWKGEGDLGGAVKGRLAEYGLLPSLEWMVDGQHFAPVEPSIWPLQDGHSPVEALANESWEGQA